MNEIWKPIPEWEGIYEISNQGNVRRVGCWITGLGTVCPPEESTVGYLRRDTKYALLARTDYDTGEIIRRNMNVPNMVHSLFIRPVSPATRFNYRDGNPENCAADNLIIRHSKMAIKRTTQLQRTTLRRDRARRIRELYATGDYTMTALASRFGIDLSAVSLIISDKRQTG